MTGRLLRHPRAELVALGQNRGHGFAAAHALVCYPTDTVYSFIPKNGCSTLRLSLAVANGCIAGPEDWPWIHPNNATFAATLRDLVTARFTFVVLRCPHARLASVFLDKIVSHMPQFWLLFRMERDNLDPEHLTFRDFVTLLTQPDALCADIHWRPQSDFLVYEDYDAYYPMEAFSGAARDIEKRGGFKVLDARPLTRHGTDRFVSEQQGCFADTPIAQIRQMLQSGRAPGHAALYDQSLADTVAGLYADDISVYADRCGYSGLMFAQQTTCF